MKTNNNFTRTVLTLFALAFLLPTASVSAQEVSPDDAPALSTEGKYSTKGFSVRPHLAGMIWSVTDEFASVDGESGRGLGLGLGYGFSELFSLSIGYSGATIFDNQGPGDYGLYHLDLIGRFTLGNPTKKFRGYLDVAGTAIVSRTVTVGGANVETSGGAGSIGAGALYFVSSKVALELGVIGSLGTTTTIDVNGVEIDISDLDLATSSRRMHVGIAWYLR